MATSFPTAPLVGPVRRPLGVTLVVILTWLAAIGDLIGGVALLAGADDRSMRSDLGLTETEMRWSGGVMLVLGLITVLVAIGLSRGSRFARFLVAVVMIAHIAGSVWAMTQLDWDDQRSTGVSAIIQVALSLLVLGLLFGEKADRFFLRDD
jgi:hypothetical protein